MSIQTEWVQVGDLAAGFASNANTLKFVNDLDGKTLDFHMENGWLIQHIFHKDNRLTWEILEGNGAGEKITEHYTATSIREGIYFIDFIKSKEKATSVSLVINLNTNNGTAVINRMPSQKNTMRPAYQRIIDGDSLTAVDTEFIQFSIGSSYIKGRGHKTTCDLIGKRIQYTYSPNESYEHVYLNQNYYSWQCLKGVEKGLADTDTCYYYKIDHELYFFVWCEKIIPTAGVIMIDLENLKTTGKIIGYDGTDFEKLNNFPVGAYAKILNITEHII